MQKLLTNPLDYNSNTYLSDYNCFGFALQTFEWADLDAYYHASDLDDFDVEELLEECVEEILNYSKRTDGPLIRVNYLDEIPLGVEAVAFRLGIEEEEIEKEVEDEDGDIFYKSTGEYRNALDDFHFIWRDVDGSWWHKPGSSAIVKFKGDPEDLWGRYNSKIAWFARHPSDEIEGQWDKFEE